MEKDYKDNKMIDKFQFNDIDNIFNDEKVLNELTNDEKLKPGVGDGQGGLACCGPWGHKELGTTEGLNQTEL